MDKFSNFIINLDEYFINEQPRAFSNIYEGRRLKMVETDWVSDTWKWIASMSQSLTPTGASLSGHRDAGISQASGALVLMCLIMLSLSTLYMVWRVYMKKKYLTVYWIKEWGQSNRMSMLSSPEKDQSVNDSAQQQNKKKPEMEMIATKKGGAAAVDANEIQVDFDEDEDAEQVDMDSDGEEQDGQDDVPDGSEEEEEDEEEAPQPSKQ